MKCEVCGKEIAESQYIGYVLCNSECFYKHLWRRRISQKEKYIIIRGACYSDAGDVKNPTSDMFLGHAGRRFWIKFKDGSTLSTNNLWYGGEIPVEFRDELPDTAEFYVPSTYEICQQF